MDLNGQFGEAVGCSGRRVRGVGQTWLYGDRCGSPAGSGQAGSHTRLGRVRAASRWSRMGKPRSRVLGKRSLRDKGLSIASG